jgi:hypothetical protein
VSGAGVGATAGPSWLVTGTNRANAIEARVATQAEAWYRAIEKARSLGMLDRAVYP